MGTFVYEFEWDPVKAKINFSKHRLDFESGRDRVYAFLHSDVRGRRREKELGTISVNLHRRLEALEKQLTGESIVLQMPDGRSVTLRGGDRALDLLAGVFRADRSPDLELVAQSISSTEPGGAHMVDLARAILNSPIEEAR